VTTDYAGLVEFIVKNIVEKPEAVEVDGNSRRHRSQTVEVRLDPTDVGRVIGKGGKNIEAIRAVVKAAAIKDHQRVNVEVITEDDLDDQGDYRAEDVAGAGEPTIGDVADDPQPTSAAGYGEAGVEAEPAPASGEHPVAAREPAEE
jgi:predicted RNA-binding protein YlqC (UPF0109 family)